MHRNIRRRGLAVLAAITLALAGAVTAPGVAGAATATEVRNAALDWLAPQVTDQGALISPYTGDADPSLTTQAALALAGAGAYPDLVADMVGYLETVVDQMVAPGGSPDSPGALAWLILLATATDDDPTAFGGQNLVARLAATEKPDGLFGTSDPTFDGTFRQALSLIALSAAGTSSAPGEAWLVDQQCADGGFVAHRADTTASCPAVDPTTFAGPDTNSTAMAAIALHLTGHDAEAEAAMDWLDQVRTAEGGFAYLGGATLAQDANSTGLVALAYQTVQGAPDAGAVDALASLQVPADGHPLDRGGIAFQAGDPLVPDLMATTQALLGLAGQGLPFAPAPPIDLPDQTVVDDLDGDPAPTTPPAGDQAAPATPLAATPSYTG